MTRAILSGVSLLAFWFGWLAIVLALARYGL